MISTTDVGDNKSHNRANWNKNKPKLGTQILRFTGTATSERVTFITRSILVVQIKMGN